MDNGNVCARRARAVAPLVDNGRFDSLLAAVSNDPAYQALIMAVADRSRGADLGAYAQHTAHRGCVRTRRTSNLVQTSITASIFSRSKTKRSHVFATGGVG